MASDRKYAMVRRRSVTRTAILFLMAVTNMDMRSPSRPFGGLIGPKGRIAVAISFNIHVNFRI